MQEALEFWGILSVSACNATNIMPSRWIFQNASQRKLFSPGFFVIQAENLQNQGKHDQRSTTKVRLGQTPPHKPATTYTLGSHIMSSIDWQTSPRAAQGAAQTTRKPILLDFFNPE